MAGGVAFLEKMSKPRKTKSEPLTGFTILELMVVIFVITILTTIYLAGYRSGEKSFRLQRAANKLASDIRRAAELSMSAKDSKDSCAGITANAYGIYAVSLAPTSYKLYADTAGNDRLYSPSDCVIEDIKLEKGVIIQDINTVPKKASISFQPPDPQTFIKWTNPDDETGSVTITLGLQNDPTKIRKVTVNRSGLIDID